MPSFHSAFQALRDGSWVSLDRIKGYALLCISLFMAGAVIWIGLSTQGKDLQGSPIGTDFLNVYATSVILHRGEVARVYDPPYEHEVEKEITGYDAPYYGWHYPPPFLGVAYFLAYMPYSVALAVYLAIGFVAFFSVIRALAPPFKESLYAILAFPGIFINCGNGQNGFLTASLCGAGFLALNKKPWLAGLFFGLLAYKPQFFALIPLALVIGRSYRAAFWSLACALFVSLMSWVWLGGEIWTAFLDNTAFTKHIVLEQGNTGWEKIQSVFSMLRKAGAGIETAYALHFAVALMALAVVALVWRNREATPETKATALCAGALLATPYVLDYDLVLLAVPIAMMARQGLASRFLPYEKSFLALLWIWPLLARSVGTITLPATPLFLVALLFFCVQRLRHTRPAQLRVMT